MPSAALFRVLLVACLVVLWGGIGGCRNVQAPPQAPSSPGEPSPPSVPASVLDAARGVWKSTREAHPLHVQAVFSAPVPQGYLAVVVTEPPPHVTAESAGRALRAAAIEARDWTIGVDGAGRDLVAVLEAPQTDPDRELLDERFAHLHRYLFGTSYGARVHAPSEGVPQPSALDVRVPPNALKEWVIGSAKSFYRLNADGDGAPQRLGPHTLPGVYVAEKDGLVVWALPVQADLCQYPVGTREFAVASDVILGALQREEMVFVVGRERVNSTLTVPPLRTESLQRLADFRARYERELLEDLRRRLASNAPSGNGVVRHPLELHQSFQRNNLFAGRLASSADWCPILLSPELVEDEFGGELNISDQILKSWSLNGTVRYQGFGYPDPTEWPAAQPLTDELSASSLTFNWNTKGAFALVRWGDTSALALLRTGALPVSYAPEGKASDGKSSPDASTIERAERRNHDYFAQQNDPHLARVVAYSAFLNIAEAYGLRATCVGVPPETSSGEKYLESLATRMLAGDDAPRVRRAETPAQEQALADLRSHYQQVRSQAGPVAAAEFIHYIAGVRGISSVPQPRPDIRAFAQAVAGEHLFGLDPELVSLFDRDGVLEDYSKATHAQARDSWVRAASVVVSRAVDRDTVVNGRPATILTMGGHNIGGVPLTITVSDSARDGEPQLELEGYSREYRLDKRNTVSLAGDDVLIMSEADVGRGLTEPLLIYGALKRNRIDEEEAEARLAESTRQASLPPTIPPARKGTGVRETPLTLTRRPRAGGVEYTVSGGDRTYPSTRELFAELPKLVRAKGTPEVPIHLAGFPSREHVESLLSGIGAVLAGRYPGGVVILATVSESASSEGPSTVGVKDGVTVQDGGLADIPGNPAVHEYKLEVRARGSRITIQLIQKGESGLLQRLGSALAQRLGMTSPPRLRMDLDGFFRDFPGLREYLFHFFRIERVPWPKWFNADLLNPPPCPMSLPARELAFASRGTSRE